VGGALSPDSVEPTQSAVRVGTCRDAADDASVSTEAGMPAFGHDADNSSSEASCSHLACSSTESCPAVQGPKEVSLIAAGHSLTVLCSANGETYVCGGGKDGVLGLGDESDIFHVEQLIPVPSLQVGHCCLSHMFRRYNLKERHAVHYHVIHIQSPLSFG